MVVSCSEKGFRIGGEALIKAYNLLKQKLGRAPSVSEMQEKTKTYRNTILKELPDYDFTDLRTLEQPAEVGAARQEGIQKSLEQKAKEKYKNKPYVRFLGGKRGQSTSKVSEVVFPNEALEEKYLNFLLEKYSYPGSSPSSPITNKFLSEQFNISPYTIERINGFYKKQLNLEYPKGKSKSEITQKRNDNLRKARLYLGGKKYQNINDSQEQTKIIQNDYYRNNPKEILKNKPLIDLLNLKLVDGEIISKNKTEKQLLNIAKSERGVFDIDHISQVKDAKINTEYPINRQMIPYNTNLGFVNAVRSYVEKNPDDIEGIKEIEKVLEKFNIRIKTDKGIIGPKEIPALDETNNIMPNFLKNLQTYGAKIPEKKLQQYQKQLPGVAGKAAATGATTLALTTLANAETPDTISPEQGGLTKSEMGVAGAGLALGTKKGRELTGKALLKGLSGIGTPLGLVGLTAGLKDEDQSILDALKEEAQAPTRSLYPIFAKESVKLTRGATSGLEKLAGPTARRIAQQVLNLGLPFSAAAKIATKLTPFGYALGAYDVGKLVYDEVQQEKARIAAMTPEERKQHELETENTMMMGEAMPENVEVTGEKNIPTTDDVINKYAYGGRVNFEKGSDPKDKPILPINPMIGGEDPRGSLQDPGRRDVLKGMGLLGAGVAAGKLGLLKLGKAIKKAPLTNIVKPMGKTMTQFPKWFPMLVNRIRKEGKQIPIYKEVEVTLTKPEYDKLSKEGVTVYDRHLGRTDWYKEKLIKEGVPRYYTDKKTDEIIGYKYEVKDLPGTIVKEMNGEEIRVYFPNAYGRNVEMTYKAPKVSVDMKGKKVKYDAEFEVNDAVPEMAGPEDVPDFFPGTVDNLDDVYGGASKIEQYATKAKQPRTTLGDEVVNRWDAGQPSMTVKELKVTRKQRRRAQAEAKAVELGKPSAFNDTEFLKDFYELGDDFD
jgi:hypothetical protein